jgi:hypothetical protein
MSEGFNNNGHYADAIALHRSSEKDSRQYPALESLKLGRATYIRNFGILF